MKKIRLPLLVKLLLAGLVAIVSVGGINSTLYKVWALEPVKAPVIEVQHARNFSVEYHDSYKIARILTPWPGAKEPLTYLLIRRGTAAPKGYDGATVVEVPVRSVISTSVTILPFLEKLGDVDSLVGLGGGRYVYSPAIRAKKLPEVGPEGGMGRNIDIERIVELQPDVLFCYAYTEVEREIADRLTRMGIPAVITSDYLEDTPLGRAEWIKFISLFFDQEKDAGKSFGAVAKRYRDLRSLVEKVKGKPTVMANAAFNSSWYVPGGKSGPAILIGDAGGRYLWANTQKRGSLPLDFEAVYEKAASADCWINSGGWKCLDDAVADDERYSGFAPFRSGRIYNNNARMNAAGGNDYYEGGMANPDIVLADLISILHPELLPEHDLVYYRKLKWERK